MLRSSIGEIAFYSSYFSPRQPIRFGLQQRKIQHLIRTDLGRVVNRYSLDKHPLRIAFCRMVENE